MTNHDTSITTYATTENLSMKYLDKVDATKNCPGFRLWKVEASDGVNYIMASDTSSAIDTRLFFATNGALSSKTITLIGDNPDVQVWEGLRD